MSTDSFDVGGVRGRWEPARRRLIVHHTLGSSPGEDEARRILEHLDRWTGPEGPIDMLVDAEGAAGAGVAYRLAVNPWFYARRGRLRVAIYNAARVERYLISAFAALTGVEMREFLDREGAEAWLDERLGKEPAPSAPREPI